MTDQREAKGKWTLTVILLLVAFGYAVLRYHVFRGTPWGDFPLYINNKAISLASVFFIALSYLFGPLARFWPKSIVPYLGTRKFLGLVGFGLGAVHAMISLLLFTPAHYGRFFEEDGSVNFTGELSMLFGVLAFFLFAIISLSSLVPLAKERWQQLQHAGYLGLLLIFLHVATMGFSGWIDRSRWPGGIMIPISLLAAVVLAAALLLRVTVLISPGDWAKQRQK